MDWLSHTQPTMLGHVKYNEHLITASVLSTYASGHTEPSLSKNFKACHHLPSFCDNPSTTCISSNACTNLSHYPSIPSRISRFKKMTKRHMPILGEKILGCKRPQGSCKTTYKQEAISMHCLRAMFQMKKRSTETHPHTFS